MRLRKSAATSRRHTATQRAFALTLLAVVATMCSLCSAARAVSPGQPPCTDAVALPQRSVHQPCPALRPALDPAGLGGSVVGAPAAVPGLGSQLGSTSGSLGQGVTGIASTATTGLALKALGTWVSGGAAFVLHETALVLAQTTAPRLGSTWFSGTYWRVARIAAVLTLPFLFAASIQALMRCDLALLLRAALGYLPLAMLAVAIAAPLTMLLLSASDQLAAAVSSAAGHKGVDFLDRAIAPLGALGSTSGSPFLAFLVALFTVAGALFLWIELLMREAAVYVIVLMLPLAFAAFVWPARRIWAIRSLELLVALILSKFAIVAVLSLGGAALSQSANTSLAGLLAGVVLLVLGAFAPWALLRLLPLTELASGAAGALRGHSGAAVRALQHTDAWATEAQRWTAATAHMRRTADDAASASSTAHPPDAASDYAASPASAGAASAPADQAASVSAGAPSAATAASPAANPAPTDPHLHDASEGDAGTPPAQWILAGRLDLMPPDPRGASEGPGTHDQNEGVGHDGTEDAGS